MARRPTHSRLLAGCLLLACSPLWANDPSQTPNPLGALPEGYSVESIQARALDGGRVGASASAIANAPCEQAWEVFTDFDAMERFLPGITQSSVEPIGPNRIKLIQSGSARVGPFSRSYASERELTLDKPRRVDSKSSASDELHIVSSTSFSPREKGCLIHYEVDAQAPPWAPAFVAVGFAKTQAAKQMGAMLLEISKRQPRQNSASESADPPGADSSRPNSR
jgi:carbon monoxide dehydrogenase subunit G